MARRPRGHIGTPIPENQGSAGHIRTFWTRRPNGNANTKSCEGRMATEPAQTLWCPRILSGDYTKSLPAAGEIHHPPSATESRHRSWSTHTSASMEHNLISGLPGLPSATGPAASSRTGPDHMTNTRYHHAWSASNRNLAGISGWTSKGLPRIRT